jgi:nicotinamidase/pyrazinamidase
LEGPSPEGDIVVPSVNALVASFEVVVLAVAGQTSRQALLVRLAARGQGKDPYDMVELVYGVQTLR